VSLGQPFSVLHIPRLGTDWSRVVVEGTAQVQLAQGPGHYIGTALPGEQGNVALAGHRVGRGSPFLDLDRLRPGDPIVIETAGGWFVYRVLGEAATGSFDGDPSGIPGREIVRPSDVAVISPTPGAPADGAPISKATAPEGPPALAG
jgi:sortase A